MERKIKKWKKGKIKNKKTDILRSISKQSGESVESVLKKKKKAMVGRICRKGRCCSSYFRINCLFSSALSSRQ